MGLGQLQKLRSIGRRLQPLSLTTGYGEVLGTWCMTSLEEEQSHLLAGGIPRKQGFSMEFVSYATTCRTSDGDLLDTLCHQYYGHLNGSVEAVLDANQGLADEPQPFRAGVLIVLPDLPSQIDSSVLLWD